MYPGMKTGYLVLSLLLLGLVSGCESTHRNLDLELGSYRQAKIHHAAERIGEGLDSPLRFCLRKVEDARFRDSAGYLGASLSQEHADLWVRQAIKALSSERFVVCDDATSAGDYCLDVQLVKAYVRGQSTNKMATVVILVKVFDEQGQLVSSEYYRGLKTAVNWSNSSEEIAKAMNIALEEAVELFAEDAVQRLKDLMNPSEEG